MKRFIQITCMAIAVFCLISCTGKNKEQQPETAELDTQIEISAASEAVLEKAAPAPAAAAQSNFPARFVGRWYDYDDQDEFLFELTADGTYIGRYGSQGKAGLNGELLEIKYNDHADNSLYEVAFDGNKMTFTDLKRGFSESHYIKK